MVSFAAGLGGAGFGDATGGAGEAAFFDSSLLIGNLLVVAGFGPGYLIWMNKTSSYTFLVLPVKRHAQTDQGHFD